MRRKRGKRGKQEGAPAIAAGKGRPPKRSSVRTLDEELARIATEEAASAPGELGPREQANIARELLDVFFNIWIRFAVDLGRELRMSPWQWDFVIYDGGKDYRFRESFNFARLREVTLEEDLFPFRHILKGELVRTAGTTYVRVGFVLEEGRRFDQAVAVSARNSYLIYNEPAKRFGAHALKAALAEPLRVWIRSEVRADPALLWDYCHEKLRKGR